MSQFIIVLTAVLMCSISISVSAAEKIFNDPNAAMRYLMAIGFMPTITDDEGKALADVTDAKTFQALPAALKSKVGEAMGFRIKKLLEYAKNCPDCNFMPDSSYNAEDIVPPYKTLRKFARFLNAGAWKAFISGQQKEAATLWVAVFRFGDDVENYGPMISYMIGHAIREIAVKSMKNALAGECKPEAKTIMVDYLKALPRPAFSLKEGLTFEKTFGDKMLEILNADPKSLVELLPADDTAMTTVKKTGAGCNANQRVLMGALEMAMMDGIAFEKGADNTAILARLVKDKYLKNAPECPEKGKYSTDLISEKEYKVSCSCGSTFEAPRNVEYEVQVKDPAKLEAKALEYHSSGKYAKDRKEIAEYYDKMMAMDALQPDGLKIIADLQADYEKRGNLLIPNAIDFHKAFGKQLQLQQEIDSIIK